MREECFVFFNDAFCDDEAKKYSVLNYTEKRKGKKCIKGRCHSREGLTHHSPPQNEKPIARRMNDNLLSKVNILWLFWNRHYSANLRIHSNRRGETYSDLRVDLLSLEFLRELQMLLFDARAFIWIQGMWLCGMCDVHNWHLIIDSIEQKTDLKLMWTRQFENRKKDC